MTDSIRVLKDWGIPTDSAMSAIHTLSVDQDYRSWGENRLSMFLKELSGETVTFADPAKELRTTLAYFVQEAVTRNVAGEPVNSSAVLKRAKELATSYIAENPWTFAQPEETAATNSNGKPRRKKGAKQEGAARIYQEESANGEVDKKVVIGRFIDELEMTKSGATTYFYNMKKKFSNV